MKVEERLADSLRNDESWGRADWVDPVGRVRAALRRRRRRQAIAAATVTAVVVAGTVVGLAQLTGTGSSRIAPSGPVPTPSPSTTTTADTQRYPLCGAGALGAPTIGYVSPATGEHAFTVRLVNSGDACSVRGYPATTLTTSAGAPIPFAYADGQGQYVTHDVPHWVNLGRGAAAYVEVAKYRCDTHTFQSADSVRLSFDGGASVTAQVPTSVAFDYCGANDPGSQVELSPVAATEAELFAPSTEPTGTFADGAPGTPHYVVEMTDSGGTVQGTLTFLYQDGRTTVEHTFTGSVLGDVITLSMDRGAPATATLSAHGFVLTGCRHWMRWYRTPADCTFVAEAHVSG